MTEADRTNWTAHPLRNGSGKWVVVGPPDPDNGNMSPVICTVEHSAPYTAEQTEMEARLIAAAPGLLEACKLARAFGSAGDTHDGLSVSEFLRAAIAKAEGTEP